MSQAQERRRAEMWEQVHQHEFEKMKNDVNATKAKRDALSPESPEYAAVNAEYEDKYRAAEAFFMKYQES